MLPWQQGLMVLLENAAHCETDELGDATRAGVNAAGIRARDAAT